MVKIVKNRAISSLLLVVKFVNKAKIGFTLFWSQISLTISLTFFKFQSVPAYSVSGRGTNRQFYCTGVIIYNKLDNSFFVSAERQTFLGFEMTANLPDISPLRKLF